jgi:hypothetical protein
MQEQQPKLTTAPCRQVKAHTIVCWDLLGVTKAQCAEVTYVGIEQGLAGTGQKGAQPAHARF